MERCVMLLISSSCHSHSSQERLGGEGGGVCGDYELSHDRVCVCV